MINHPSRIPLLRLIGASSLALMLGACVVEEPRRDGVDYGYVAGYGSSAYDDDDTYYNDADDGTYGSDRTYTPAYDYNADRYYSPSYPAPAYGGYYGPGYYGPGYYGPAYSYGPTGTIIYHYDDYDRRDRNWKESYRRNNSRDNDYRPRNNNDRPPSRPQDSRPPQVRPPQNDAPAKEPKRHLLRPEKNVPAPAPSAPSTSAPQPDKGGSRWQDRRRAE